MKTKGNISGIKCIINSMKRKYKDLLHKEILERLTENNIDTTEEITSSLIDSTLEQYAASHPYGMESLRDILTILNTSGIQIPIDDPNQELRDTAGWIRHPEVPKAQMPSNIENFSRTRNREGD